VGRGRSDPSKPIGGRIRKYLLPKPEEFRAVAKAFNKAERMAPEDFFMTAIIINELEKTMDRIRAGEDYWKALLDWAAGVANFQRRVGVRRLRKIFATVIEVYESKKREG